MKQNVVRERSYGFALGIVRLQRELALRREYVISKQLVRVGTRVGANVEEGLAGQSRREFVAKLSIARKEAFECNYWLRLIRDADMAPMDLVQPLIDESASLARILTSIVKTAEANEGRARRFE